MYQFQAIECEREQEFATQIKQDIKKVFKNANCQVIIQEHDENYDTDCKVLVYKDGKYGVGAVELNFSEDDCMDDSIRWFPNENDCVYFLRHHFWDDSINTKQFIRKALRYLSMPYCYMI